MKRRGLDLKGYILQDAVWEFYLNLARAFSLLGRGVPGRKVAACAPKDGGAAMMERVKRYARENPDCPVALQELPDMMDAFTRLCTVADRPGVDAAKVRAWAAELQARCMGYHAGLGEAMKAEAEGAAMRAELAKEKGNKREQRKRKRKEKTERKGARVLDVKYLLGEAGWTVQQVADKWGISVRTVEGLAQQARAWKVLQKRTPGRRGPGRLVGGKAGEIALEHGTSEPEED